MTETAGTETDQTETSATETADKEVDAKEPEPGVGSRAIVEHQSPELGPELGGEPRREPGTIRMEREPGLAPEEVPGPETGEEPTPEPEQQRAEPEPEQEPVREPGPLQLQVRAGTKKRARCLTLPESGLEPVREPGCQATRVTEFNNQLGSTEETTVHDVVETAAQEPQQELELAGSSIQPGVQSPLWGSRSRR